MKNKIIHIQGFKFKHFFMPGLYSIILMGIVANFGYMAKCVDEKTGETLSVGTKYPLSEYFDDGYEVKSSGWIFGFHIYLYKKIKK